MHYDFPGKPFRNIELSIVHPRGGNNDVQFVNYDWNTTCNREYKVGRADYIFSHAQCDQKIILTIIIPFNQKRAYRETTRRARNHPYYPFSPCLEVQFRKKNSQSLQVRESFDF